MKEKAATKQLQMESKPLGPRHRILGCEEITGDKVEDTLKQRPLQWRNLMVRTVCATTGKKGEDLRNLWLKIYKGDLRWGVRDARLRAKEKNWPRKDSNAYLQNHDRNSWIASSIRKSLQTELKANEKKNYIKLMN